MKTILACLLLVSLNIAAQGVCVSTPTYNGDSILLQGNPTALMVTKVSQGQVKWTEVISFFDLWPMWQGESCYPKSSLSSRYLFGIFWGWVLWVHDDYNTMVRLTPDCRIEYQQSYILVDAGEDCEGMSEVVEITLSEEHYPGR